MTSIDELQHEVKRHFGVMMNVNWRQNMMSIDDNLCMTLPLIYINVTGVFKIARKILLTRKIILKRTSFVTRTIYKSVRFYEPQII